MAAVKKHMTIVGIGELLWDLYPGERHLGGAPANAALHASRFGNDAVIVSAVGRDALGSEARETLASWGMTSAYIQECAGKPTGTVKIRLDGKGVPHFQCSRDVAFDSLEWRPELSLLASRADGVITGTLGQRSSRSGKTIQAFLRKAHAEGAAILFDINFREWNRRTRKTVFETLPMTSILKMNENEMDRLCAVFGIRSGNAERSLVRIVEKCGLKMAALSLGERGCVLSNGTECVRSPGVAVRVKDTTGCGDAFSAALLDGFLKGRPLSEIAESANTAGAFIATFSGATPFYRLEDLERFRKTHRRRGALKKS